MNRSTGEKISRPRRRNSTMKQGVLVSVLCLGIGTQILGFDLQSERQKMLNRERRVIFNNDGSEVFLFPADKPITPEAVLDIRTTALAGTHVDAIFYNPSSPSFGLVTHYTEVLGMRDYYEGRHQRQGKVNASWALIEQGNDSLAMMVDFAHKHDIELFLSKRMNDTHDAGRHRPGNPNPTFAPLKRRHPEYLVGSYEKRPPLGRWSAVKYAHPAVRDLAYDYLEEVCQNYDIDGIELDFFRHPQLFRSVLSGEHATQQELDLMTGLIKRIRQMTEREGEKRGRPFLLAIRVPDSVEYCRAMGIDLEVWLEQNLVDILVGSGYFRLNHWNYLVELGHRHGVKVYPGLSESRLGDTDVAPFSRTMDQARRNYRARAAQAWASGADGVYMFNFFNPHAPIFREIGDPEVLAGLDKTYFVTVRNRTGAASRWVAGGDEFCRIPTLSPHDPLRLAVGETAELQLVIGDDLQDAVANGLNPNAACYLRGDVEDTVAVELNGAKLSDGQMQGPWLRIPLQPEQLKQGFNTIALIRTSGPDPDASPWRPAQKALAFDEKGYVAIDDLPELNSTTWSVWVKPTTAQDYSSVMNAMFEGANAGHLLDLKGRTPRLVWNHGMVRSDLSSPEPLPPNQWAHLAVTLDADTGTLSLFVNGECADRADSVTTTPFSRIDLGRRIVTNNHPFRGLMKNVRIYNRALIEAEVKALGEALHANQHPNLDVGLVAHYPFDQTQGGLARDASSNGPDAKVRFGSVMIADLVIAIDYQQ